MAVNGDYGLSMAKAFQETANGLGVKILANIPYIEGRYVDAEYILNLATISLVL